MNGLKEFAYVFLLDAGMSLYSMSTPALRETDFYQAHNSGILEAMVENGGNWDGVADPVYGAMCLSLFASHICEKYSFSRLISRSASFLPITAAVAATALLIARELGVDYTNIPILNLFNNNTSDVNDIPIAVISGLVNIKLALAYYHLEKLYMDTVKGTAIQAE